MANPLTEREQSSKTFLEEVKQRFKELNPSVALSSKSDSKGRWTAIATANHSQIGYNVQVYRRPDRISAEVVMYADAQLNRRVFQLLTREKMAIDGEVKEALTWESHGEDVHRKDYSRGWHIVASHVGSVSDSEQDRKHHRDWAVATIGMLMTAFDARLKRAIGKATVA